MAEVGFESTVATPHEAIATVFSEWLSTERFTSAEDRNAVLDQHIDYCLSEGLAGDDPGNAFTRKRRGHSARVAQRLGLFNSEEVANDEYYALQMSEGLIALSGLFRLQCVVMARNPEEYRTRRFGSKFIGLNITHEVGKQLLRRFNGLPMFDDLSQPVIEFTELHENTGRVNEEATAAQEKLFDQVQVAGRRRKLYIALLKAQRPWLQLATDYVLFGAAKNDGDLARVPFKEPCSLSYAKTVYPFTRTKAPFFELSQTSLKRSGSLA